MFIYNSNFFAGNFTQASLVLIIQLIQMFTNLKIPSNFDNLIKFLNIQKTNYQKIWQCQTCKMKIETKENKKTQCDICLDK